MGWIKLKDKKPKYDKQVLIYFKAGGIFTTHLTNDSEYGDVWVDYEDYHSFDSVEYWMELPKKPRQ